MVKGVLKFTPISVAFEKDCPLATAEYTLAANIYAQASSISGHPDKKQFQKAIPMIFSTSEQTDKDQLRLKFSPKVGGPVAAVAHVPLAEIQKLPNKIHRVKAQIAACDNNKAIIPGKVAGTLVFELHFALDVKTHLHIKVLDAVLERDTEAIGKMDPFVEITIAGKTVKTTVKDEAGKTPMWNEDFTFEVSDTAAPIHLVVKDEDVTSDDLVGEAKLDGKKAGWFDFTENHVERTLELLFEGKIAGKLRVATRYYL